MSQEEKESLSQTKTLSLSTKRASLLEAAFEKIAHVQVTKTDTTAAILEEQLSAEKDGRKTERFFWILACTVLFDCIALPQAGWAALPVFLLELVMLIGLARWLGMDYVSVWLERVFHKYIPKPPESGKGG